MRKNLRKMVVVVAVILLGVYVFTIWFHGTHIKKSEYFLKQVKVREGEKEKKIPWEEFFIGVLAKEMDPTYEEEALCAQAVLIRTNIFREISENKDIILEDDYLTPRDMENLWGKKKALKIQNRLKKVMEDTENMILVYQDRPAFVPYHLLSNGKTREGIEAFGKDSYPYLKKKECPKDVDAELEVQTLTLTYKEVKEFCRPFLLAVDKKQRAKEFCGKDFEIVKTDSAGYVIKLRIGENVYSGEKFREALHLPSGCFTLQDQEKHLKITTKGVGHGVGMSQFTANEMAKEGKTYDEILAYFYEGTEKKEVAEILLDSE